MSFDTLGLTPELLRAVADQGYTEPTPVQREAIPLVLARRDVLAGAQTGTGKTAAFVLPILQILNATRPAAVQAVRPDAPRHRRDATREPIRTLVLTPTRELALQVEESVRTYGAHHRIRSVAIYGGVGFEPQARALRAGPGIVVATPGRLLDHAGQGTIDLSHVEILVLDEADRMLDMGFIRDIRRILALLPAERQNLLFSATFSSDIRSLAGGLLRDPVTVQVTPRNTATDLVTQVAFPVDRERKRELLSHLIRSGRIEQALVFTRTKHGANRLAEQLGRDGINAAAIHGNKSQGQRVRALDDFKAGRANILVATEVASRGLDIEQLPHVVNYELPMVAEDYVHRIGRTGRAGSTGDAISLVCVDEGPLLREIERLLGHPIPTEVIPGFAPDRSIRPEPILQRSGGGRSFAPRHGAPRPVTARPNLPARTGPGGPPRHGFRPGIGDSADRHRVERADQPRGPRPMHGDRDRSRGPAPAGAGIGNARPSRNDGPPWAAGPRPHQAGHRPHQPGPRPGSSGPRVPFDPQRPSFGGQRPNRPSGPAQHHEGPRPSERPTRSGDDRRFATLPGERLARVRPRD